jgi:hypothetical protein
VVVVSRKSGAVRILALGGPQVEIRFRDKVELFLSTTTSRSNYLRNLINHFLYATMAPKKSKRTADSINSRLALVMKSGKCVGRNTTPCARY